MGMKRVQQQDSLQENQQNKNQIPQQISTSTSTSSTSTNTIIIRGQKNNEKDESKFSRVKRVLTGSLLLGRGNRENIKRFFGVNIEDVESYNDTGIPYVVYRLCNYIENNAFNNPTLFRLSGGNPRLTEKLRNSFERRGDADLEGAACPSTAATLLRQYFKELPQPLVPSSMVARLVHIHSQFENNHEAWIELTNQLLQSLPTCHYKLLSYLIIYLSKYESRHGRECGVCGVFAPVVLPHVPPATTLLRDILNETSRLFKTPNSIFRDSSDNSTSLITITKDNNKDILFALKPRKRKDNNCENCCQENKLIRSNSEERILVNSTKESNKSIRRVSSHEDFKTYRRLHILQSIGQEMGHGVRCGGLPLHERSTNISPVPPPAAAVTQAALPSPCHQIITTERQEFDVENLRCTERFSRSIIPRGRRQARRRKIKLCQNNNNNNNDDDDQSKENDNNNKTDESFYFESSSKNNQSTTAAAAAASATSQSFLEMLNSGPSRSPSPARALARASDEDPNDPEITNWHYQHLTNENLNIINNEEKNNENSTYHINTTLSPRNSQLLSTRRFYNDENDNYEDDDDDSELFNLTTIPPLPLLPPPPPPPPSQIIKKITTTTTTDIELKNLTKKINGLKKKIKKYEEQFEEMNGYRPSHSDKMNNRDIKKLLVELNKLRKEHKLLKEDSINTNIFHNNNNKINKIDNLSLQCKLKNNNNNNNNGSEKSNALLMEEMVKDMEKKLTDKRLKLNRNKNIEEYNYDELLDEKTSLQKALLQIESIFGRAVSKEDRIVVRPLYDRYRTLKRLLIRASSSKHKDSISELATILEHEAMDFTSSSSSSLVINDENKQQQQQVTLNDCIDSSSLFTTDSDSQQSSSEESRGIAAVVVTSGTSEILHSMPYDDLIAQKIIIREEKKRLRRSLKEFEMEFELKTGRKMQKDDRGKQIQIIYESYKQTKGKLRLIEALIAKNG
ncbi:protein FAM13A isoform X2 [Aphidius gifuensis]|uniref:protein FAM13A isoform X2 n=1 Tax=Aphidius gifuensis TaxID=684658 RepID=UPI001CDBD03B|nr:protein FAM13A isoform X2 [Aphidius gifuensis]